MTNSRYSDTIKSVIQWLKNPAMTAFPDFSGLRQLLSSHQYAEFLDGFDGVYATTNPSDLALLRVLAGEGLVQCLHSHSNEPPATEIASRFFQLLAAGKVELPDDFLSQLGGKDLSSADKPMQERTGQQSPRPSQTLGRTTAKDQTVIRTKRVIQVMDYQWGSYSVSDALGLRQSVFRSQQEKCFLRALSLRFPGLTALPNYPLDQIADFNKLQSVLDPQTISYGRRCRIDALLVIPDEGDPVAAFELDSEFHDTPEARHRDELKDRLLQVVGVPFFRLRAQESSTMDTDEWYSLLTEQVLDQVSCGEKIRSRRFYSSLVPVGN
ncbi:MAG TPA: DUF2726 domain-containing protein [Rhodocyclaceae bacterium]